MHIALLGTRGIPNHYGGFEQMASELSVRLVQRGHTVAVYCSSKHPYTSGSWKGVTLHHQKDPEELLGTAGQFIYDLNCILHANKQPYDVLLNLGYTSSSIWAKAFTKSVPIVTHMDGLEWKRSKYPKQVQQFLKQAEKWAISGSNHHISDNPAITAYLNKNYLIDPFEISYGAQVVPLADNAPLSNPYDLLVARMEPENHIETILKAYSASTNTTQLIVVGGPENTYAKRLKKTYTSELITFYGTEYDIERLNALRTHSRYYFHGHSVGGTNPSLLEAMGCGCAIFAHDNPFNKAVLRDNACYFNQHVHLAKSLDQADTQPWQEWKANNIQEIKHAHSWEHITDAYENMFHQVITNWKQEHHV